MTVAPWAGDASYNVHIPGEGDGLDWARIKEEHDARLALEGEVFVGVTEVRSEGTGIERMERAREQAKVLMAMGKKRVATVRGGSKRVSSELPEA
jgi:hypothetical protein